MEAIYFQGFSYPIFDIRRHFSNYNYQHKKDVYEDILYKLYAWDDEGFHNCPADKDVFLVKHFYPMAVADFGIISDVTKKIG